MMSTNFNFMVKRLQLMTSLISFENKNYTTEEFIQIEEYEIPEWVRPIFNFIKDWHEGKSSFIQKTSGSTGKPKEILIQKKSMIRSALFTIERLQLPVQAKALLCISADFIGGKMMLVRAIIGHWHIHIIEPKSNLMESILWDHYDFTAMVPLQITSALASPQSKVLLNRFRQIIIGGGQVKKSTEALLQDIDAEVYSTFGMTETVSHVALRKLNGPDKARHFQVIGDNQVGVTNNGCLMIKGSVTNNQWIETNDLVDIVDRGFIWKGRQDLIVNTGGVKVPIDATEHSIKKQLNIEEEHLILWKKPHEELGESLIGISDHMAVLLLIKNKQNELKESLPKYHFPKFWFLVKEIKRTPSGKLDRLNTFNSVEKEFIL